jgi:hypothetical protein
MAVEPKIQVSTHFFPSTQNVPAIVVQSTALDGSYMLWAGITTADSEAAAINTIEEGCLAKDWACGMPGVTVGPTQNHPKMYVYY